MIRALLSVFLFTGLSGTAQLNQVTSFGTNPGNLTMYTYIPSGISGPAPLVVVMHGCTQTAAQAAAQTGWNKLADLHKFYVVYPEQKTANNIQSCFNWFQTADQDKDQGENLSIKQMVDHMKANYAIDNAKVFATGLSAGAAMTEVVCATYPEVYSAGAVLAGGPYKSATTVFEASAAMNGTVTKTPAQWAALVTGQNPGYSGSYPRMAFFHGTADPVVNYNNMAESVKQWTELHNAGQTPYASISNYAGSSSVTMAYYTPNLQEVAVRTYSISGFGHAIPLDTGSCLQQGGQTGTYAYDIGFHSTWHAAHFFGLIDTTVATVTISGPSFVFMNQGNVHFTATSVMATSYNWSVPPNASITNGQGTGDLYMNFGNAPGFVSAYAIDAGGCLSGPESFWVDMCTCFSLEEISNNAYVSIAALDNHVLVVKSDKGKLACIKVYDLMGKEIFTQDTSGESVSLQLPESLTEGIYLVKVWGNGILLNKKILIR